MTPALACSRRSALRQIGRSIEVSHGLDGLSELDLAPARALLGETELVGVVPAAQLGQPLLGLRGITSRAGREAGVDPELMLRTDAALEAFARLASPAQATAPGAGACGGLGFAVLALGGRLSTGPALTLASAGRSAGVARRRPCRNGMLSLRLREPRWGRRRRDGRGCAARRSQPLHRDRRRGAHRVPGNAHHGDRGGVRRARVLDSTHPQREISEEELASTARRVARSWSW